MSLPAKRPAPSTPAGSAPTSQGSSSVPGSRRCAMRQNTHWGSQSAGPSPAGPDSAMTPRPGAGPLDRAAASRLEASPSPGRAPGRKWGARRAGPRKWAVGALRGSLGDGGREGASGGAPGVAPPPRLYGTDVRRGARTRRDDVRVGSRGGGTTGWPRGAARGPPGSKE